MAEPRELLQTDSSLIWRDVPWILRRFSVLDKDLVAAPGAPTEGDRYIILSGWGGTHTNEMAEWHAITGAAAAWHYTKPIKGMPIWVVDETCYYTWSGSAWVKLPGTSSSAVVVPYYEKHVVTAGEAASGIITLIVDTYTVGNNSLLVYRMGALQCITEDYAETNLSTVTFGAAVLEENDILIFRWTK